MKNLTSIIHECQILDDEFSCISQLRQVDLSPSKYEIFDL